MIDEICKIEFEDMMQESCFEFRNILGIIKRVWHLGFFLGKLRNLSKYPNYAIDMVREQPFKNNMYINNILYSNAHVHVYRNKVAFSFSTCRNTTLPCFTEVLI